MSKKGSTSKAYEFSIGIPWSNTAYKIEVCIFTKDILEANILTMGGLTMDILIDIGGYSHKIGYSKRR